MQMRFKVDHLKNYLLEQRFCQVQRNDWRESSLKIPPKSYVELYLLLEFVSTLIQ